MIEVTFILAEIAVKLSGSKVPYAGRVKVRYQGVWGTLCENDWKTETAEVLCRQLGYEGVELDLTAYNARWYSSAAIYDVGPGPVWFNGDGCNGREMNLTECQLHQEVHCSSDTIQLICKVNAISVDGERYKIHEYTLLYVVISLSTEIWLRLKTLSGC